MLRPLRVRHYVAIMATRGVSPESLLEATGIDAKQLHAPDYLLHADQVRAVIRKLLSISPDPAIGLEMGLKTELSSLGILAGALLSCQRLAQTLEVWSRYSEPIAGTITRLAVEWTQQAHFALEVIDQEADLEVRRFCVEELVGMIKGLGEAESGVGPTFLGVDFAYPRPPQAGRYAQVLGCPLHFDARRTRVVVDGDWARRAVINSDRELSQLCVDRCDQLLEKLRAEQMPGTLASRIRELLMLSPRKTLSLDQAAQQLCLSTRTLKRRLQDEGTNFQSLVLRYRMNLASEYLQAGRMPAREIADLLGFSDERALRRALKTWGSQSPPASGSPSAILDWRDH